MLMEDEDLHVTKKGNLGIGAPDEACVGCARISEVGGIRYWALGIRHLEVGYR